MLFQTSIHSGKCNFRQVFILADGVSSKSSFWKKSVQVHVYRGNVFLRSVRITSKTIKLNMADYFLTEPRKAKQPNYLAKNVFKPHLS